MTREAFDAAMQEEFWREVVQRVADEVPDTLLLAEAFWLMEGYFVRTLGMHRVYNSAFMNMLRNEENDKYRQLIKNTLVYDPEILKRYVNFMNNPDEKLLWNSTAKAISTSESVRCSPPCQGCLCSGTVRLKAILKSMEWNTTAHTGMRLPTKI